MVLGAKNVKETSLPWRAEGRGQRLGQRRTLKMETLVTGWDH